MLSLLTYNSCTERESGLASVPKVDPNVSDSGPSRQAPGSDVDVAVKGQSTSMMAPKKKFLTDYRCDETTLAQQPGTVCIL
jgi:hypothetical protein